MLQKKLFVTLLSFIFISNIFLISFADDENQEDSQTNNTYIETSSEISTEETNINSRAAIIYDRNSGTILYKKSENEQRKMASTTKIMTAIVVIENVNLSDIVTVSQKSAGTSGSRLGLHTGDTITVNNLLYGLLLCSGNDAAVALAEYVGGNVENFANMMNKKAASLGLLNTHFVTPHGLDNDAHYTTALELAKMADYALKNETFSKIVSTKNYTVTISDHTKNLSNTNELLGTSDGVYGVKTGFTNGANRCLVTAVKRNNLDIICVVLGADTKKFRTQDSVKLINYVFSNFEVVNVQEIINNQFELWKSKNLDTFVVNKGISNNIDINFLKIQSNYIPIKINKIKNIKVDITCQKTFDAPVCLNTTIGKISLKIDNEELLALDIITANEVKKKTTHDYFNYFAKNFTKIIENSYN